MKKYIVYPLCLAAIALTACTGKDEKADSKSNEENIPAVKVETVESRVVDQLGTYTASVEAQIVNNISSNMPNRIKQILVDEGQRVSAGQKVEVNYNRALELFKIGGGTKQQVDAMEIQLVNAKNALAQAERTLRNARENTVLTSPISGVVTARNYDPGDMTGNLPILTVARVQPVKIVINVTESELPRVHKGMPADIRFDTYGDELFKGVVSTVMPTVDPQSRTLGGEITLANADGKVLPGMFGRVTLNLGKADRVVVPDKAVVKQQGSGNQYIYVYNSDGTVSFNQVQLGQRLGSEYELLSGVEPGSQVVVSGQARLANGVKVKVTK